MNFPPDPDPTRTPRLALAVGQRVRLAGNSAPYAVRASSDRFAVLVQQVPFQPKGTLRYTVIDWQRDVRGACNLSGWGYGDGAFTLDECAQMLREFESGQLEISHRNWVPLEEITLVARPLQVEKA